MMTDADWADDVKGRRSYSGIAAGSRKPLRRRGILCRLLPRNKTWSV